MNSPVSRDGRLQDFRHRKGDTRDREQGVLPSAAQKWGGRTLISNFRSLTNDQKVRDRATMIRTPNMRVPRPLNLQIRFAINSGGTATRGQPLLPFTYPSPGSATHIQVTVKRGIDPSSSPTVDDYFIGVNEILPIDTITAAQLTVEVRAVGPPGNLDLIDTTTAWVEAICSPVSNIGPTNEIHPWAVATNPAFIATNAAATTLLAPNTQRVQFFIVNTSTNADLIVQLGLGPNGDPPVFGATPKGTYVLPRNQFAVYESPCPCGFKGTVFGIWSNAGNGGAMISSGLVF